MIGMTSSELTVRGAIEVGTLRLPSGGMIGVVVRPGPLSPGSAAKVADLRAHAVGHLVCFLVAAPVPKVPSQSI